MSNCLTRYEFWASENGKTIKKWTDWFKYDGPMEKWQLKNRLKNEYKEED